MLGTSSLDALSAAREAKLAAEQAYRAAIVQAHAEHGTRLTADAAGVTRQAVQQIVSRHAERRADLEARYAAIVAWHTGGYSLKDARPVTALRNSRAAIRARRGLPAEPTVRDEARWLAEGTILDALRSGEPVTIPADGRRPETTFTPQDLDELAGMVLAGAGSDSDIPF